MAVGSLVVGRGPGRFGRWWRRAATPVVVAAVLAGATVAAWFTARHHARDLVQQTALEQAGTTAGVLASLLEQEVAAREASDTNWIPALDAWATERVAAVSLPAGVVAHVSGPDGAGLGAAGPDRCAGQAKGLARRRLHEPDVAAGDAGTDTSRRPLACAVALVRSGAGRVIGAVTVHGRVDDAAMAEVMSRNLAVLAAATSAGATGLILLAVFSLSRWRRRARVVRDDRRRHDATAAAAGEVLARLAPHLAYEAEHEPRVVDLRRTVEFVSGRAGAPELRPVELGPLVGECLDRRRAELEGPTRELRRDLPADVWVQADPERLALAIDHGVRNAIEALGDGPGRIEVRLHEHWGRVDLVIRDTGDRVSRRERRRVFDTGFSTKRGHSGLGLALVRKVSEEMGGWAELRHPWGGGTLLRLCLPRRRAPRAGELTPSRPRRSLEDYLPPPPSGPTEAVPDDPVESTTTSGVSGDTLELEADRQLEGDVAEAPEAGSTMELSESREFEPDEVGDLAFGNREADGEDPEPVTGDTMELPADALLEADAEDRGPALDEDFDAGDFDAHAPPPDPATEDAADVEPEPPATEADDATADEAADFFGGKD